MRTSYVVVPFLVVAALSCHDPLAPDPTGRWGGEHMSLNIIPGGAAAEFDCAHGAITGSVLTASDGSFNAVGTIVPEHGGPARVDEVLPTYPARYAGRIAVNTMTLTVTRTDSAVTIGTFTLQRNALGHLFKCLAPL